MFGWIPRMLVWVLPWESNRRARRQKLTQNNNTSALFLMEMGFQQWR